MISFEMLQARDKSWKSSASFESSNGSKYFAVGEYNASEVIGIGYINAYRLYRILVKYCDPRICSVLSLMDISVLRPYSRTTGNIPLLTIQMKVVATNSRK